MPVIYSNGSTGGGAVSIPELYSDPVSPSPEEAWVLASSSGVTGSPIGLLLALTYAAPLLSYQFSYKTIEGPIVRVGLA